MICSDFIQLEFRYTQEMYTFIHNHHINPLTYKRPLLIKFWEKLLYILTHSSLCIFFSFNDSQLLFYIWLHLSFPLLLTNLYIINFHSILHNRTLLILHITFYLITNRIKIRLFTNVTAILIKGHDQQNMIT